jgi:hypothetical protein
MKSFFGYYWAALLLEGFRQDFPSFRPDHTHAAPKTKPSTSKPKRLRLVSSPPPADSKLRPELDSAMAAGEQHSTPQISSSSKNSSGRPVTPFWKGRPRAQTSQHPLLSAVPPLISIDCFLADAEKYERDARRYWDIFYKRHEDKVAILAPLFVK